MRSIRLGIAGAVALSAVVGLVGCAPAAPPAEERVLRLGDDIPPGGFDLLTAPGGFLGQALFEGLGRSSGRAGELEPALAESWEYDDTRTELTFHLRPDVLFVDGEPFDAAAFKKSFDIVHAVYPVPSLDEMELRDDATVVFHLTAPDVMFLNNVALRTVRSPKALDDEELVKAEPFGTGPYVIDDEASTAGVEYTLVRNEDYWGPEAYPYDEVVITILQDVTARVNALRGGQVDFVKVDRFTSPGLEADGFTIHAASLNWIGLILGDRAGELNPAIGDVRVRQAMNHAIDREAIVQGVNGGLAVANNQVFAEGQPGYREELRDDYAYDPDRARELLAEAGYADGFDLVIPKDPVFIGPAIADYIPALTQYFGDVGIRLTFEDIELMDMITAINSGTYPVLMFTEPVTNTFFDWIDAKEMSADKGGWRAFADEHVQELADVIAAGSDEEQAEAWHELGKVVHDLAWFVVLSHPQTLHAMTADVRVEGDTVVLNAIVPAA